jgi:hypothetical protein
MFETVKITEELGLEYAKYLESVRIHNSTQSINIDMDDVQDLIKGLIDLLTPPFINGDD